MAQQILNIGAAADDGTGDTLRDGGDKINDNFTELYGVVAVIGETIRDTIGSALAAGSGVTITPNDPGDTITIASSVAQYTDEMARDALGTALVAGTGITITPNDGADTITIAATGGGGATAADVANTPAGTITATDVQAALNELDSEKLAKVSNLSGLTDKIAAAKNLQGVYNLAQSAVAQSITGTTAETTLATITIPAGAIGANGNVYIEALFNRTGTGSKTLRFRFGGTVVMQISITSQGTLCRKRVSNRNTENSQVCSAAADAGFGATTPLALAIDTSAAVDITITVQLANAADSCTLESYAVQLSPKA